MRPDTVLHWHRDLVSHRHTARSRPGRAGQPRTRAPDPPSRAASGAGQSQLGLPAQSTASCWSCVYCFARRTHSYLDLDTGIGFDSQIVVKVNAPDLLRRELASRGWRGQHIAMGTNVDCYQRAEGRYRLMPGTLTTLRDLDLLRSASAVTDVGVSVSVGFLDETLWRTVEPGTPAPERRLDVVRTLTGHGIGCGSDAPAQPRATVRAIAATGATSVTPLTPHLRPGAREWFMTWLGRHHKRLVRHYEALYADGAYAPTWYQRRITGQVHELAAEYGIGPSGPGAARRLRQPAQAGPKERAPDCTQLSLL